MKKAITLFIALLVAISITGCAKQPTSKRTTLTNQDSASQTVGSPSARNAQRKAAIFQLTNALKNYFKDNQSYPSMRSNSIAKTGIFSSDQNENPLIPEYLVNVVLDPTNKNNYNYYYEEEAGKYLLFAFLESEKNQTNEQYFCVDSYTVYNSPTTIDFNPMTIGRCKKVISSQKQQELDSPSLISELRQIKTSLDIFHSMKGNYPLRLMDLYPIVFTNKNILQREDIFYAYSPATNPQNYHLGINVSANIKELGNDKDFNSKNNGYVNGFDGKDPIYDVTN